MAIIFFKNEIIADTWDRFELGFMLVWGEGTMRGVGRKELYSIL